ncbi:MAG: diguanylate cyclase [Romboutsia sp.]
MNQFEKQRNQKIFEILMVLKVIYILLSVVAIISSSTLRHSIEPKMLVLCAGIIPLFIALYFLWIVYYQKNREDSKPQLKDILETILLLLIFIMILNLTNMHESSYKFICIFIILIGAIQFGRAYSLCISICSALIIVGVDIFSVGIKPELSMYFESDLVLSGALLATSYILGMYVNVEKEHGDHLIVLVNKDELTGLYNHRYFQEYLTKTMENTDRDKTESSLLFMDIDYFKNYNDINGHQSGDLLLREIGAILKGCVRKGDIVARYGGEEFAAILPDTKEENAIIVGERIRQAIESADFYGQKNQPNKNITISIGVSSYPKRAKTKHQFINTADDALYRAKSFNKNRVETYHDILEYVCSQMDVKEDTVESLKAFINMINKKDRYTYGHTERVVIYTNWFSEYLELEEEDKIQLQIAAYLHDIGKVEITEEILNKKEKLTDDEFNLLRSHPTMGVELIQHIKEFVSFIPLIKHHHERYDGRGYPDGLKGKEIPYLARVITIVDSFDAMTSNRPYNITKTHEEGIKELRDNAGTQFDPILVEQFIDMLNKSKNNF